MKENPENPLTWTRAFAGPDSDTIIDLCHPVTGRSQIYNQTLDEIRMRYPGAEVVDFEEHCKAKGSKQDAEPIIWDEITEERYDEMLTVLPPEAWQRGAFLVGEPTDHHADNGQARFAAFKAEYGKYFSLLHPITRKQFLAMFSGETAVTA